MSREDTDAFCFFSGKRRRKERNLESMTYVRTNQDAAGKQYVRKLTYSALCLAMALVLPFLTGQIPEIGSMLCPMHIPALLCGFLCGWPWGLGMGFAAPLLRHVIFGMPPMPTALAMAFELAAYGAVSGALYRLLPKKGASVYVSLVAAMVAGRVVWGAVQYVIFGLQGTAFTAAAFLAGAVTTAIPGIVLQLVMIPPLVIVLRKTKLMLND